MATSLQSFNLISSFTTFPDYAMLRTTPSNFPFKTIKFNPKSVGQVDIKDALQSFTNYFAHPNSSFISTDEAYSWVLELCGNQKALNLGRQVHAHIITYNGQGNSVFLRTKLVFMYGKCGAIFDAQKLFDEMSQRTIFTWNAMIGGYVSNDLPWEALYLYGNMRAFGVNADAWTFPCVLKACGLVQDLKVGSEVHGYAVKTGCDSNGFVINALVSMYSKCGDTFGARQLFEKIEEKDDVVLWNSIISGYSAGGRPVEALKLFREMQEIGVGMNTYTSVTALQACEEPSYIRSGMEIHAAILKSNDYMHIYVLNALLAMYARCRKVREALQIFHMIFGKDRISWNSMLSGLVQNGLYIEALRLFHEMLGAGQKPDQVALMSVLGASARLQKLHSGMEIHAFALKSGLETDIQFANSLLDMYAKCCHVKYMEHVFGSMLNRDNISWTTAMAGHAQNNCHIKALDVFREVQAEGLKIDAMMIGSILLACSSLKQLNLVKEIHGCIIRRELCDLVISNTLVDAYGECGNIALASRVFEMIENKDVVSWTSMISAYVDAGLGNEALSLFRTMKQSGVKPDSVALVCILSAAASFSTLKKGREIHGFLTRQGFVLEGNIANSLVDMYARCGTLENASKVFNLVKVKDTVLWTCMIHARGMHGDGKLAIELFNEMEMDNITPDHVTFLALLYACSHSGMTIEGQQYLEIMRHRYHLEPWPEHYACVVDLLGRANHLEKAYQFVSSMPIEPNAVVWSALLGACHAHSNDHIADIAAWKLLDLEPENPGNYVLVSNVFAAAGRWDDVEEVREMMRRKGLRKNPACSWIEIKDKVHTFMARDKSHPCSDQIYEKLSQIIEILRKAGGYTPQTKYVLHNVEEEEKTKMLYAHSERLAIAYGLLNSPGGTPIRVTKNLRVCGDCHVFIKLVSKFFDREIIVRDASRFHHFDRGSCSCGDFW